MMRWLLAVAPLLAAVAAAWLRFTGGLPEEAFRSIFLAGSAGWFVLAMWAQARRVDKKPD